VAFPTHSKYVIIGAGIHGLSTAYHLACELENTGKGNGSDIIILDKSAIAAGASGIACGVVRNNYFQPAMRELMAHSADIWVENAETYSFNQVGYMQISHEGMHSDIADIAQQQKDIGYASTLIEGEADSAKYMKEIFPDWQAKGITSVLHEEKSGFAHNTKAMYGLAGQAESKGVRIITGVEVTGFDRSGGSITAIETNRGKIETDYVIVGVGPWAKTIWEMLELPHDIDVRNTVGELHSGVAMWTFWSLQEGTLGVDPDMQKMANGNMPPVIHVDTDAPLFSDVDGSLVTDEAWGIYYKPDQHFGGIQGGAMPYVVEAKPDDVAVDPYGPESPDFVVGDDFAHMWCSALAFCQSRFEGQIGLYKNEPSGGIGCFTPDSFPVFDVFHQNCYFIADSNHGFKMIGVGKLVAQEIVHGKTALLEPFRFSRFEAGKLHPVSNSPYPWS
jgi:glycine/D-amino acid oxidase-like deaminating enzyme